MVAICSYKPQIDKWKPSVAKPRIPLCRGARRSNVVFAGEPLVENKVNLASIDNMCWKKYGIKEWYNKILRKGWPGVKGKVRLGRPVVNKFGEIIVITLNDQRMPKCTLIGKA